MSTVVITEKEYLKAQEVFAAAADLVCVPAPSTEPELARAIRENRASHAIVGIVRYEGELYASLPRGGVLARFGVGHDGIDKRKATAAGLLCTNTPSALDESVAEHAISLMLAAARGLPDLVAGVKAGEWSVQVGSELAGKTLAVIGCGPIGRTAARIASYGFHMRVIGYTRTLRAENVPGFDRIVTDFAEVVRDANFVSLHIPANLDTAHFIDEAKLDLLPETSWLINTARGSVVDENALYDALAGRRLAGAALDVFEREPYEPVDPSRDLRTLPNVILTPHVASNTKEANRRMAEGAMRNVRFAESGCWSDMNLLNPEVLE